MPAWSRSREPPSSTGEYDGLRPWGLACPCAWTGEWSDPRDPAPPTSLPTSLAARGGVLRSGPLLGEAANGAMCHMRMLGSPGMTSISLLAGLLLPCRFSAAASPSLRKIECDSLGQVRFYPSGASTSTTPRCQPIRVARHVRRDRAGHRALKASVGRCTGTFSCCLDIRTGTRL